MSKDLANKNIKKLYQINTYFRFFFKEEAVFTYLLKIVERIFNYTPNT